MHLVKCLRVLGAPDVLSRAIPPLLRTVLQGFIGQRRFHSILFKNNGVTPAARENKFLGNVFYILFFSLRFP